MHNGGINKRNRASILASLLLAISRKNDFQPRAGVKDLIQEINDCAKSKMEEYGKGEMFGEIEICLSLSEGNANKYRKALIDTIAVLLDLNIASAIVNGSDVLGVFYEEFLKYANDAKESGIVFTPRHIATFGASVADVQPNSVVFDPACGTGGFLLAASDKMKYDSSSMEQFCNGSLHGIEKDSLIATLAIVNLAFRGYASWDIQGGNGLKKVPSRIPDRCLINPPFAIKECEWMFVDRALEIMKPGGLLFAVVPTSMMMSANNDRGEIAWRVNMLKQHTLAAVVKLPEDLFYPYVSKGTCGVLLKAGQPHSEGSGDVFWACLHDGVKRTKTTLVKRDNIKRVERALKRFVTVGERPEFVHEEIDCAPIVTNGLKAEFLDLAPENHIGKNTDLGRFNLEIVFRSANSAKEMLRTSILTQLPQYSDCRPFPLTQFVKHYEKGKSGRSNGLKDGALPLISTSETDNGISRTVDSNGVHKVYPDGLITVSSNGGSCCAFYHDYEFAANPDVFVLFLHDECMSPEFSMFLCAAINNESWRYNYFRKFNQTQLELLTVQMPAQKNGQIDGNRIAQIFKQAKIGM